MCPGHVTDYISNILNFLFHGSIVDRDDGSEIEIQDQDQKRDATDTLHENGEDHPRGIAMRMWIHM
jgi:hypothetical protein